MQGATPQAGRLRWTSSIGGGLRAYLLRRTRLLSNTGYWARHTGAIQRATLRHLLAKAADTEFGRSHGFGRLATLPDNELARAYRRSVRMGDYEMVRDQMARMREGGEPDVCWPGVVRDWAQTSGTTGGEKFIPVSKEMMRSNYRAAMDIFAHASRMGVSLPRLFGGRLLFLGGSTDVSTNEHGIRTGDLSGIVAGLIHWPLSEVYAPGKDIALMSHWPDKIEAMARSSVRQDVRMISGMASWGLVLFQRVLELAKEKDPSIRTLSDVWPHLALFVHGGVKYGPFDSRVREVWSGSPEIDIPNRLEVYPASEGFIALQDTAGEPGLRLQSDVGNYFEFVPVEEMGADNPRAFGADEVERGQRYVVVMTTCAGLWRYVIGDVVEFDSLAHEGPVRMRIVGRHRHFINAFGENLIVEEIEKAVETARYESGASVGEFTAAPVYPAPDRSGGLELAIEWLGDRENGALERFGRSFDESLKRINVDYKTKRTDSLGMGEPTITTLPAGAFHAWMDARGKLGGQHKMPRCANSREILEDVIRVASGGAHKSC